MTPPPIANLRPRDKVRVTTESGQRVGYVESVTPEALVLEPGSHNAASPVFEWSQIRRVERRARNPAAPLLTGIVGAVPLGMLGWFVGLVLACCNPEGAEARVLAVVTVGAMVGFLIGAPCGLVVRHWELSYESAAPEA